MHLENAIYRVLHEKSDLTASFTEHLIFQKKVPFPHALWENIGKSQWEKLKSGHSTSSKWYIQGASRNKQYHYFFHAASKISMKKEKNSYTCTLD